MALNWDDMRIFLAVARVESLSKAGQVLKIDPATVGRRIARFETEVGVTLFAKSPQGYELTRDGVRLLTHAQDAETAMTSGLSDLSDEQDSLRGVIRIGAPDGCANYVLPQVLAAIAKIHPELNLQIVALPRVINLSKREADLVISVSAPQTGRLAVQKITDYHLSFAAMQGYLARHEPIETLEQVKAHPIIGYVPDLIFDKELDYLEGLELEQNGFTSNTASVQVNMVRAELGLGVVHEFCVPHVPQMQRVLPDVLRLKRTFYLVRHADDRKVDRLTRFSDLLVREMRRVVKELEAQCAGQDQSA